MRRLRNLAPAEQVLAVVIVVCCGFAVAGGVIAHRLRADGPAANAALADPAATEQVATAVGDAVGKAFSYNYANLDAAQDEAHQVLVGSARQRFDKLFGTMRQQAAQQHLVQQTTVRDIAVKESHGDSARLLVFVDQQRLRSGDGAGSASTAGSSGAADRSGTTGMDITAQRIGGRWKIARISFG